MRREENIKHRIADRPYLRLVATSVFEIPERVSQYDPDLFVVWNCKQGRHEIHSLANIGDSFGMVVPFRELDARTIEVIKKFDQKIRGDAMIKEMDKSNEAVELAQAKERRDEVRAIAEEVAPAFRKVAWEGV